MRLLTGEEKIFTCQHCGNRTSHRHLAIHEQEVSLGYNSYINEKIMASFYVNFFECSTCSGITIKVLFSEDVEDAEEINYDKVESLFPKDKKFPEDMPKGVTKGYLEAAKVKKISRPAFVMLIRRALESLCEDKGAAGRNLEAKVKSLAEKGLLPGSFVEMVDSIRLFGNIGAHDMEVDFTEEQIDTIDYFFIALVEYIYIAPAKLNKLKESIKKK